MRRRVNGEADSRLIGLFTKLEGEKNEEDLMAGGGNHYKRRERSKYEGPLGTFPGSDTHLLIFFRMLSLDSFLHFVEEVRNRPGSTLFFKGYSYQI